MNLKTATPREIAEFIVNKDGDNDPVEVFRATRWWGLNMARRKQLNPDFTKLADEAASFVSGLEIQDTYAANRLDPHAMNTFPEPDINEAASYLAVKISTDPDRFTPGMRALAKAYESQLERIADLEEDVERLRPKEAFVPVTVFKSSNANKEIEVESLGDGLLRVTVEDENSHDYVGIDLPKEKGLELTTALAKWAGLDGVEWQEIDDPPEDGVEVLRLHGNGYVDSGEATKHGYRNGGCLGTKATHWAPLPKPPAVKS